MEAVNEELPRGKKVDLGTVGTIEEILTGPSHIPDGSMNIFGALRRAMATTGYSELKKNCGAVRGDGRGRAAQALADAVRRFVRRRRARPP